MRRSTVHPSLIPIVLAFSLLAVPALGAPTAADADFDKNGKVDFDDFLDFIGVFGQESEPHDLNADGKVDFDDFLLFVGFFGEGVGSAEAAIYDVDPPSTLLAAGSTEAEISLRTDAITSCSYSLGQATTLAEMTPFDEGAGSTTHRTIVRNLDPDPNVVNDVFVRTASDPDSVLHLRYRAVNDAQPGYPKTGNLWGYWAHRPKGLAHMARIDLWMGVDMPASDIRELRRLNPNVLVLPDINAVERRGLTEDYYLKDVNGNRIEVWPNSFRLNLTKQYVAEEQARYAYQKILDSELMYDGMFFDNVMTTQSWLKQDIYGNPVQIDSDEDGVEDDPATFDAAWNEGVFHEIRTFRELMPHALVTGHSMRIDEPGVTELFNGISIGFWTADVLEGRLGFPLLWDRYSDWCDLSLRPTVTMIESSPHDQIAYGYDYQPTQKIPPSTLAFAESYHPFVRFGLAFTLMNDGYFAHEFGDTHHGNDWWYDELDFDLGQPLGPAELVIVGDVSDANLLDVAGFEEPLALPWRFQVTTTDGAAASIQRDTETAAEGGASVRIDVTSVSTHVWHIGVEQRDRSLMKGVSYDLSFQARADNPRTISVNSQKSSPDWRNYGLSQSVEIGSDWEEYTVPFEASETVDDARIQFFLGQSTGSVWLDDVRLTVRPAEVYRREFENGLVLLNATRGPVVSPVDAGFRRLTGSQAAMFEWIVDDADSAFVTTGSWLQAEYDSGEWKAAGPFYHDWGAYCHSGTGQAFWGLDIPADDTYTVRAWWPAWTGASAWTRQAIYQVAVNGTVIASATLDQTTGGDEWHDVAQVALSAAEDVEVRMRTGDGRSAVADAIHILSASRYNDGSAAETVRLQPMDGIVLERN